jgi:quinol monooxygenase YgiN
MEQIMQCSNDTRREPRLTEMFSRRSVIGTFGAVMAIVSFSPLAISPSRSEQNQGAINMSQYAMDKKTIGEAVSGGGLLVVAQWEAKQGEADKVADILQRFLTEAQRDLGTKLFLIGRGKENPAQFLFYELFRDEAAFVAHQESVYFDTYIAKQALPLLAKRERMQYVLL